MGLLRFDTDSETTIGGLMKWLIIGAAVRIVLSQCGTNVVRPSASQTARKEINSPSIASLTANQQSTSGAEGDLQHQNCCAIF